MPANFPGNWSDVDHEAFEAGTEQWVEITADHNFGLYEVEIEVFTRKIRHRKLYPGLGSSNSPAYGDWKSGYP